MRGSAYAIGSLRVDFLWGLKKHPGPVYHRHGFLENGEREFEEGTTKILRNRSF